MKTFIQYLLEEEDYRMNHRAPGPDNGSPMHNVSPSIYPEDFHGPNGFRYYSDLGNSYDRHSHNKVTSVKDKPGEFVRVHRAIPISVYKEALKKDVPLEHMMKKGDWVSTSREYAQEHGESVLGKRKYKVVSRRVRAKHLYTDGNSIHEWGYHPDEEDNK